MEDPLPFWFQNPGKHSNISRDWGGWKSYPSPVKCNISGLRRGMGSCCTSNACMQGAWLNRLDSVCVIHRLILLGIVVKLFLLFCTMTSEYSDGLLYIVCTACYKTNNKIFNLLEVNLLNFKAWRIIIQPPNAIIPKDKVINQVHIKNVLYPIKYSLLLFANHWLLEGGVEGQGLLSSILEVRSFKVWKETVKSLIKAYLPPGNEFALIFSNSC